MLCEEVRRYLEVMDGDGASAFLSEDDRRAVVQHLAGCVNCQHFAEWLRSQDQAIGRAIRNVSVPAGLRERILDHLGRMEPARSLSRRVRRLAVVAAAAAVLVGGALLLLWLGRQGHPEVTHLDDNHLVRLAIAWEFEPLTPPAETRRDWRSLQAWYRRETKIELFWPNGVRRAAIRGVGRVRVQGTYVAALELVPSHAPRSSFLVAILPRSRFELDGSPTGSVRVLRDSHSVSVGTWSYGDAHFVVVYRGPFDDIRPCFRGLGTATASLTPRRRALEG